MREDMFKVIVERPRSGSRMRNAKIRRLKESDTRRRVSGRRLATEQIGGKALNENLSPLRRYLFKQRGRKWDDVFSEICARLDTGSTVKMHVRDHLDDFVMRKIRIDETGMYWGTSWWGDPRTPDHWRADLFVCPIDGTLKETALLLEKFSLQKLKFVSWREKLSAKSVNFVKLDERHFLVKLGGCWFEIMTSLSPLTGYFSELDLYEVIIGNRNRQATEWVISSKKQLSKKELKKHGLKNGGGDV